MFVVSGKKKGKKKGKTLNLNEFLSTGDNSPAPGTSFVFASKSSWAEESETADGDCKYLLQPSPNYFLRFIANIKNVD